MPRPYTFANVFFSDGPEVDTAECRVIEEEFCHEIAVVTVEDRHAARKRFKTGSPVQINWGVEPREVRTFIGYVNHIEPVRTYENEREVPKIRAYCIGPTWPLNDTGFLTYRGVDATYPIRTIGNEYRFDTRYVQRHDRTWPVLHQGGESYWKFMVLCAQRAGWALFPRGMEIHCLDRRTAVANRRHGVPVLARRRSGGVVDKFQAEHGSSTPHGGDLAVRDIYGVDPRTGRQVSMRNQANTERPVFNAQPLRPAFRGSDVSLTFEDIDEAHSKLLSAERGNRFSTQARVEGTTKPSARVGSAVYVTGFDEGNDGGWYVQRGEHVIRPGGKSWMRLTVSRDTEESATPPRSQVFTNTPIPSRSVRLVNGNWAVR